MIRRFATLLLFSCVVAFVAHAQTLDPGSKIPTTVLAAEQEGAVFPRSQPQSPPPGFDAPEVAGTSDRKCVEFSDGQVPASRRSGDFIIGGDIHALNAGRPGKVWWSPRHDPGSLKATLVVRGVLLDQPSITSRFTSKDYAWPISRDGIVDREHAFYPSGFGLPNPGRWLLTVTSGDDWGCFIVTVRP
jgi:hypothetical protein